MYGIDFKIILCLLTNVYMSMYGSICFLYYLVVGVKNMSVTHSSIYKFTIYKIYCEHIYSFNEYLKKQLLNSYYVPGIVLSWGYKNGKDEALIRSSCLVGNIQTWIIMDRCRVSPVEHRDHFTQLKRQRFLGKVTIKPIILARSNLFFWGNRNKIRRKKTWAKDWIWETAWQNFKRWGCRNGLGPGHGGLCTVLVREPALYLWILWSIWRVLSWNHMLLDLCLSYLFDSCVKGDSKRGTDLRSWNDWGKKLQ